jgi:hypothetical protein
MKQCLGTIDGKQDIRCVFSSGNASLQMDIHLPFLIDNTGHMSPLPGITIQHLQLVDDP